MRLSRIVCRGLILINTALGAGAGFAQEAPAPEVEMAAPLSAEGLRDQFGHPIAEATFAGKARLLYFGYTHCPDACPTALAALTRVLDRLPPATASRIVPVLVAIDPARDDPATLRDYLSAFHPSIVAVTGPVEAIDDLAWRYRVPLIRHPSGGERGYAVDHGTAFVLVNARGRVAGRLAYDADDDRLTAFLTPAVRGYEAAAQ